MLLFVGSPLYSLYLRALGAKIGPGVVILTQHPPVCTDLLTIGAGAVIRRDTFLSCYRAEAGVIRTGPVTIGAGAFVGQAAVLDIGATLGDGAQLGHGSALYEGQTIPAGERRQGTPAEQRIDSTCRRSIQWRAAVAGVPRTPSPSSWGCSRSTCRWHSAVRSSSPPRYRPSARSSGRPRPTS